MNSFIQPCVCPMWQCHGKENCLNISSVLSCEDVAKRTLNLINQRVCYTMTHKLWLVLLELVIQMSYILAEYVTVNCLQTADIN